MEPGNAVNGRKTNGQEPKEQKAKEREMIREAKKRLRRTLLENRRSLASEYRQEADAEIRTLLKRQPAYKAARTVFCYVSVADEVDTRQLIADMLAEGRRVAVPRCGRTGNPAGRADSYMEAFEIASFDDLTPGAYGIPEPKEGCRSVSPREIDLCVVPCLCVGTTGIRLGYGGGYYDRYLPRLRPGTVCAALCRERTQGAEPPAESHDRPVSMTVTEKHVIFYEFTK